MYMSARVCGFLYVCACVFVCVCTCVFDACVRACVCVFFCHTSFLLCPQVQGLVKLTCYEKCVLHFHYATCWKEYRGRFSVDKISDKVG